MAQNKQNDMQKSGQNHYSLSETDKRILQILLEDARLSLRQIAKKANVSVATIMHHVRRLEGDGIIKKYTAQLDFERLEYDVEVLVEVRVSSGKLHEVERKISMNPNVFGVYDVTGQFDVIVLARFQSRRQMDAFLKELQRIPFVERTETKIILKTMKEEPISLQ